MPSSFSLDCSGPASINGLIHDEERLQALRRYDILDTAPEPAFDRMARLAAHLFDAPVALVSFVDRDRQWFKSTVGIDEEETGLDTSLCVYTLEKGDVLAIGDLAEDGQFGDSPYVTDRGFRFYAGAPLITPDDRRLGTLCVFDTEPRSPSEDTLDRLADLAAVVVDELELRRERVEHEQSRDLLRYAQALAPVGGWEYDPQVDTLTWTDEAYRIHGLPPDAEMDLDAALEFYVPEARSVIRSHVETLLEDGGEYDLELDLETAEGHRRRVRTIGRAHRSDGLTTRITGAIQDITESHRQKQALRKSQERWQRLIDKHPGPIHISVDGKYAYANEATAELLGVDTVDDLIGRDMSAFIPPDERARFHDRGQAVYEERNEADLIETRIQRPDGTERTVLVRSVPIQYEGQAAAQTMMWDVTERRRRKEVLERKNDLFAKAQDIARVGAWEYDLRTGEAALSDEAYRIHALAPGAEMTPDRSIEFYHPDDRPIIREAFTRAVEKGTSYDLELRLITDDGAQRWVRTRGEPQREEDGEIVRVRGTIQDITDQKEAEQDLRRSREQLSMAVEGANIGTWNWDTKTDTIIFNRRWAEMLGYSREELDFHFGTWKKLVHPEDLPRAMEALEAYLAGETDTYAPEIRMRTKSGNWRWIQTIGRVVERDEEGAVTRAAGIHLDIDERKRAEQALRDAKTRYQTLIEHFPDGGVFLFNEDVEYVLAGGKGLADVGLSADDFEGKTPHDLFPPEIAEKKTLYARRALEGEKHIFEQEYQGRHYRVQMLPVRTDLGEIPLGMSVSQDITEQKESREQLEQYRDYMDRLVNAVDDLFFAIDEEAQFQRWNARVPEVTGYSEEELEEMAGFDLVPESERERVAARIADAFATGSAQVEVPLLQKDGTTIPYEFVGSLIEHPEGTLHLVGVGRDIADRKERERLLQQAETFFQHAQDALFLIDVQRDGDEPTFAVQRVNPAYEAQTGLCEEDLLGCSPSEILEEEAARHMETMYRRCVDRREPLEYEEEIPFGDRMTYWTTRIAPVVVDGEVRQIVGSTRDVTERKRRREELKEAKDAAEEADRIKSALLSNMNHEFRTPLTSIISFSELLSRKPDLAETFADRILGGGRRLLHTLNTVMDFAELEAGSVSPTPIRVDVNSLVRSTVNTFSHLIDQDLSVQIHEPTGPLTASLDEHHVERVLTHLIHNAIKFTEAGTIEITLRETPDGVEVSVSDPGIGIDPEILPHMFDEFAQASSGSDRTHEGNGIGLTIVKRLVARMDGDVTLHSTLGAGTEATVRLPNLE